MQTKVFLLLPLTLFLVASCSSEPDSAPWSAGSSQRPIPAAAPTPTRTAAQVASIATAEAQVGTSLHATATALAVKETATTIAVSTARAKHAPTATVLAAIAQAQATEVAYATAVAQYERDLRVYETAIALETAVAAPAATATREAMIASNPATLSEAEVVAFVNNWMRQNPLIQSRSSYSQRTFDRLCIYGRITSASWLGDYWSFTSYRYVGKFYETTRTVAIELPWRCYR